MEKNISTRPSSWIAIFIMTGIIYIFMEVMFASVFTNGMINKYKFKPIKKSLYNKMFFKPPAYKIGANKVYLKPIKKLSLIGASSIWMFLLGGLCGICLFILYLLINKYLNLCLASLFGAIIITLLELGTGCLLNGLFKLYIWDYSNLPLNFLGQICLSHSIIYFLVVCPMAFWFFHFLSCQYKDSKDKPINLLIYYLNFLNPVSGNIAAIHEKLSKK